MEKALDNPWMITESLLHYRFERIAATLAGEKLEVGADFGCGDFRFASHFLGITREFYAIDNWLASDYATKVPANVRFYWGSVLASPFSSGSLDLALFLEVLEHLTPDVRPLDEIARVLRPGGWLVLSCPFMFPVHGAPNDYARYTLSGLRWLLARSGFELVSCWEVGNARATLLNHLATHWAFRPRRGLITMKLRLTNRLFHWMWSRRPERLLSPQIDHQLPSAGDRQSPMGYVLTARKQEPAKTPPAKRAETIVCPKCHGLLDWTTPDHPCCSACQVRFRPFQGHPALLAANQANLTHHGQGRSVPASAFEPVPMSGISR